MGTIERFEAMLAGGQDNEMLRYTLGNAYLDAGEFDKSIEHLKIALEHKPDYSAAWRQLGKAYLGAERFDEALESFDRGAKISEKNGDKQTAKEITVFRKRVMKRIAELDD